MEPVSAIIHSGRLHQTLRTGRPVWASIPVVEIVTLASRPDLAPLFYEFPQAWPAFMYHDETGTLYYASATTAYPEFVMLAISDGEPVARSCSVPLAWEGDQTTALPPDGWDWAIRTAHETRRSGSVPNLVSALEITIQPAYRGTGLSGALLAAMCSNVAHLGFTDLVAPVRPNAKADPTEPMTSYALRTRDDGLPVDPWLRVHVRAGGRILNIAPTSMTIPGTLSKWREWTGLSFDASGPVHVPGALVPVICAAEHDYAVYVEPNVWVHHPLGGPLPG
jgi:GNAT superfamily N-acetyltransferase